MASALAARTVATRVMNRKAIARLDRSIDRWEIQEGAKKVREMESRCRGLDPNFTCLILPYAAATDHVGTESYRVRTCFWFNQYLKTTGAQVLAVL